MFYNFPRVRPHICKLSIFIVARYVFCVYLLLTHCEVASYVVGTQRNVMPLQADAVAVVFLYFGAILLMAACVVAAERFSAVQDGVSMPGMLQSDGGENNFW